MFSFEIDSFLAPKMFPKISSSLSTERLSSTASSSTLLKMNSGVEAEDGALEPGPEIKLSSLSMEELFELERPKSFCPGGAQLWMIFEDVLSVADVTVVADDDAPVDIAPVAVVIVTVAVVVVTVVVVVVTVTVVVVVVAVTATVDADLVVVAVEVAKDIVVAVVVIDDDVVVFESVENVDPELSCP